MITPFLRFLLALLCSCLFIITDDSYGQVTTDTLHLDEIEVVATRIHQPLKLQPVNVQVIDSARLSFAGHSNIGTLLADESGLFIKSNGPGGLGTASQRGLSSEQIQVLWEGIPINHAMLGLTDLSLLPSNFFSSVQVSSGVPSSSFGGGLSGGLYLNSDFKPTNKVSFSQSAGSFGQSNTGLRAAVQQGNWNLSLRSQYTEAQNDFEYYNRATQQAEKRDHNRQEQKQLMASAAYENKGSQFNSTVWLSDSQNQIPGSILNTNNRARQEDQALRWLNTYETSVGAVYLNAKNFLERVELNYFDPSINVNSVSTTRRWLASTELIYPASSYLRLKGEVSAGITGAETNNYTRLQLRQQLGILFNPELSLHGQRLHLYPALRFDSYNDFGNVLSPSLGINYELFTDRLYLRGQLSRDFNPPTFNALYWAQGGNPNLVPERSNSAEAGARLILNERWLSRANITAFYSRVNDGIRWYPDDTGTFTPENVEELTSRGIELSTKSTVGFGNDFNVTLNQSATFTKTEITEPRFSGDAAPGNQLRYVPKWKYKGSLQTSYKFISALANYQWVSRRYFTDTESVASSLDPYQKVDLALRASQQLFGLTVSGNLQLNNLLNADYEVIQWYAQPRRNFQFTLTATYNF